MGRAIKDLVLARVPDQERTCGVGRGLNEIVLRESARAAKGTCSRMREIEKGINWLKKQRARLSYTYPHIVNSRLNSHPVWPYGVRIARQAVR